MWDTLNLLTETKLKLEAFGKTNNDVVRVIFVAADSAIYQTTWEDFVDNADFEYDSGFGASYISFGLRIEGVDWWLERAEYDGSEWWEYKELLQCEFPKRKITRQDIEESW